MFVRLLACLCCSKFMAICGIAKFFDDFINMRVLKSHQVSKMPYILATFATSNKPHFTWILINSILWKKNSLCSFTNEVLRAQISKKKTRFRHKFIMNLVVGHDDDAQNNFSCNVCCISTINSNGFFCSPFIDNKGTRNLPTENPFYGLYSFHFNFQWLIKNADGDVCLLANNNNDNV